MEAGSFSKFGSRNSAAHIRAHVKRNCHNPLQNILQSPRAREHVKPIPNTIVLQAVQHKSLRNPSVLQYEMLQMFCPRAFFCFFLYHKKTIRLQRVRPNTEISFHLAVHSRWPSMRPGHEQQSKQYLTLRDTVMLT